MLAKQPMSDVSSGSGRPSVNRPTTTRSHPIRRDTAKPTTAAQAASRVAPSACARLSTMDSRAGSSGVRYTAVTGTPSAARSGGGAQRPGSPRSASRQ
jgi:hypothetical protein